MLKLLTLHNIVTILHNKLNVAKRRNTIRSFDYIIKSLTIIITFILWFIINIAISIVIIVITITIIIIITAITITIASPIIMSCYIDNSIIGVCSY